MTAEEGRGVQVLKRLLDAALERLPRGDARSFTDLLDHDEAADLADALSAAGMATGTGGNVLYESLAHRVRSLSTLLEETAAADWVHQCAPTERAREMPRNAQICGLCGASRPGSGLRAVGT